MVVAHDAQIVSASEPSLEQRLLEEVDVLILVDRECAIPRAELGGGLLVLVEQADRALEEILEVDEPQLALPPLVSPEHSFHEVGWKSRSPRLSPRRYVWA